MNKEDLKEEDYLTKGIIAKKAYQTSDSHFWEFKDDAISRQKLLNYDKNIEALVVKSKYILSADVINFLRTNASSVKDVLDEYLSYTDVAVDDSDCQKDTDKYEVDGTYMLVEEIISLLKKYPKDELVIDEDQIKILDADNHIVLRTIKLYVGTQKKPPKQKFKIQE